MNLTTVEAIKDRLSAGGKAIPVEDVSADATLLSLIRAYSAHFELATGRAFERIERTETFDVELGDTRLSLRAFPVDAEAEFEVRIDSSREFETGSILDSALYYVDRTRGHVVLDNPLTYCGAGILRVTYTGGLAEVDGTDGESSSVVAEVAPDLVEACELSIVEAWNRRDGAGSQSTSFGDGSRTYEGALKLLPIVQSVLNSYRRVM